MVNLFSVKKREWGRKSSYIKLILKCNGCYTFNYVEFQNNGNIQRFMLKDLYFQNDSIIFKICFSPRYSRWSIYHHLSDLLWCLKILLCSNSLFSTLLFRGLEYIHGFVAITVSRIKSFLLLRHINKVIHAKINKLIH